jgi:hypothetical protein
VRYCSRAYPSVQVSVALRAAAAGNHVGVVNVVLLPGGPGAFSPGGPGEAARSRGAAAAREFIRQLARDCQAVGCQWTTNGRRRALDAGETTNGRQRRAPGPEQLQEPTGRMVPQPSPAAAGEGCSTRAARSRAGSRPSSTSALTRSGACGRLWRRGRGGGDPSSPSRACPCPWGGGPLATAGPRRSATCGPSGGPRAVPRWRKRFVPPSCCCC